MSETDPRPQRSDPIGVKLSDLNAIKQQILTRAAVTLAGVGLTAAAAGSIGQLISPLSEVAPGARPWLIYLAALILPLGGFFAVATMRSDPELQTALLARISSEAGHPDAVSPGFQRLFVKDIQNNFKNLNFARKCLVAGLITLVLHTYFVLILKFGNPS
jgi:hypothetical protein